MARMGVAILVCVVVLALDVTAGILGIEAQAAQNKVMFQGIGIFFPNRKSQRGFENEMFRSLWFCFIMHGW